MSARQGDGPLFLFEKGGHSNQNLLCTQKPCIPLCWNEHILVLITMPPRAGLPYEYFKMYWDYECTIRAFHHFHVDDVGFDDAPREVAAAVADVARRIPPAFPPVSAFDCQDSFLTMVVAISMMVVMMSGQYASSCCCFLPAVVVVEVVIDGSSWHSTTTPTRKQQQKLPVGAPPPPDEPVISMTGQQQQQHGHHHDQPLLSSMYFYLSADWRLEEGERAAGHDTYLIFHRAYNIPASNSVLLFFTLFWTVFTVFKVFYSFVVVP